VITPVSKPSLTPPPYLPATAKNIGTAIIIIPGGRAKNDIIDTAKIGVIKVYYKVAKIDNAINLYYSADSKPWFLIRRVQLKGKSPNKHNCKATFSNI
jgi:hypothetical protein